MHRGKKKKKAWLDFMSPAPWGAGTRAGCIEAQHRARSLEGEQTLDTMLLEGGSGSLFFHFLKRIQRGKSRFSSQSGTKPKCLVPGDTAVNQQHQTCPGAAFLQSSTEGSYLRTETPAGLQHLLAVPSAGLGSSRLLARS